MSLMMLGKRNTYSSAISTCAFVVEIVLESWKDMKCQVLEKFRLAGGNTLGSEIHKLATAEERIYCCTYL
jgi:hypothetical protein